VKCPYCAQADMAEDKENDDYACPQCGLAAPLEVLEGIERLHSAARGLGEADALEVLDRAWEQRCDMYDPWPDNTEANHVNDGRHDATAKHVFDLLRDALAEAYAERKETV
jgi:hypothetical protein